MCCSNISNIFWLVGWGVGSEVAGEPKHVSGTSHQLCLAEHGLQRRERHVQHVVHVMQWCRRQFLNQLALSLNLLGRK
jgi:hypothetical protein